MSYVPVDIFHAAADGIGMAQFPPPPGWRGAQNAERPPFLKRMNVARIRSWIERGGDVNGEPDPALINGVNLFGSPIPVVYPGNRLLIVAAECGRVDVMRLLIANGAAVNYVNHERVPLFDFAGASALLQAIGRNNDDAVRLLIEHGADVRFADDGKVRCILTHATKNPRIQKLVLAKGANIGWLDSEGRSVEDRARAVVDWFDSMVAQDGAPQSDDYPEMIRVRDTYRETCGILEATRLAGSYKKYGIQTPYPPAKDLLLLRALVCGSKTTVAGRATAGPETATAVSRLFESCPDNGVFWLVMQYWQLGDWEKPWSRVPSTPSY